MSLHQDVEEELLINGGKGILLKHLENDSKTAPILRTRIATLQNIKDCFIFVHLQKYYKTSIGFNYDLVSCKGFFV